MEAEARATELRRFIEAAVAKGASDRFIADLLKASGWAEKEIFAAFREYYEQATGVLLPARRESGESAREAFLYLIAFTTLTIWTVALGLLAVRLIDRWFPDAVVRSGTYYMYDRLNVSYQMACILIAFPIFLLVSRTINRSVAEEPRNRNSAVRKWLTYIALVIAACVLIGDAVAALAYFLQGEVTPRFLWKAVVVGALAAGVFGYYLGEVGRSNDAADKQRRKLFGAGALALVALSVILGFTATGGPSSQRAIQADVQRVRDLHHIAEAIRTAMLSGRESLPTDLDQIPAAGGMNPRTRDPETGAHYEYRVLSATGYELCAAFAVDNRTEAQQRNNYFWVHGSGRQCFRLDAKQPTPWGF